METWTFGTQPSAHVKKWGLAPAAEESAGACPHFFTWLTGAILGELKNRTTAEAGTEPEWPSAAIQKIYRELALQFHPDPGGSLEAMKAINEFYDRLKTDLPWLNRYGALL